MMYPRLKLARELLTDDGVIFISIDDNESKNLRAICDEVFGEAGFVGDVIWQKTYSPRNDSKEIPVEAEHLLAYSRNPKWTPNKLARTEEMDGRYDNPDGDARLWKAGDATAPDASTHHGMVYAIQHPITGKLLYPSNGRHWSFGQELMLAYMGEWAAYELRNLDDAVRRADVCGCDAADIEPDVRGIVLVDASEATFEASRRRYAEGRWPRLYFTGGGKAGMALKRYLDETDGRMPTNLWLYEEVGHTDEAKKELKRLFDGMAPFDTPKPTRLMKRILDIATDEDSLVLDFFSGSASMAHAVMAKNAEDGGRRAYVMVQLPEAASGAYATIADIGKERIRRAGAKIAAEVEESNRQLELGQEPKPVPDVGFRVFKLDESAIVRPKPGELVLDVVKPDTPELDLVFEMMLRWGLDLSLPVERVECAGYPCWSVAANELICCLEPGLTTRALEAVAALDPRRVLLRDSVLTDELKLNAVQAFRHRSALTGMEIDLRTI